MEKAVVDNDYLSLISDQREDVLSHDVRMLEDWIERCEARTLSLKMLDIILEDVFKNVQKTTAPPTPPTGAVPNRSSKAPHHLEQLPNIKKRLSTPKSENSKFSRTKIVKKWLETEKQEDGKFKITKCIRYHDNIISTNKRKKLSNNQKSLKIQKTKFENYFTKKTTDSKPKLKTETKPALPSRPGRSSDGDDLTQPSGVDQTKPSSVRNRPDSTLSGVADVRRNVHDSNPRKRKIAAVPIPELIKNETPKKQKISIVSNLKLLFEAAAKNSKSASRTRKF